jgi:hypothetical protein
MPKGVGHPVAMTRGAARFLGFVAWGSKFERPKTLAPSLDRDAGIKDCSEPGSTVGSYVFLLLHRLLELRAHCYQSISSLSCALFKAPTNREWALCQSSFAESYCLTTSASSSMGPMSCRLRPKCVGGSFA